MPQTINGIGTHYYGKQNVMREPGVCDRCGKRVELESYDSRLWFVVVFIPIIPLGRKRILRYCPRCTSHRAMPLEEYRQAVGEIVGSSRIRMEEQPDDPSAHVSFSQTLLGLRRLGEAREHAKMMAARFASNAAVQAQAGAVMLAAGGLEEEAARYFDKAYALDPNNEEARAFRASRLIESGGLDEAYALLDFMIRSPRDWDPGIPYRLALALQAGGRHRQALEIFSAISQGHPTLLQDQKFRKAIKYSERAEPGFPKVLSGRSYDFSPLLKAVLIMAVVALVALGINFYSSHARRVHVVSGWPGPITVKVDDQKPLEFTGPGRQEIRVAEGPHLAVVSGPFEDRIEFNISQDLFDRLFGQTAYVLNPGGLAVMMRYQIVYGDVPAGFKSPGPVLCAGKKFFAVSGIDYAFTEPPHQIKIDSHRNNEIRHALELLSGPPAYWTKVMMDEGLYREAFDYLNNWMAVIDGDDLSEVYTHVARMSNRADQALGVVKKRLAGDPSNVQWHRIYQELAKSAGVKREKLVTEYDALLAKDPLNADLIYLRARLENDLDRTLDLQGRALSLDPQNQTVLRARHYCLMSRGDFAGAARDARSLVRETNNELWSRLMLADALLAQGQTEGLDELLGAAAQPGEDFREEVASYLVKAWSVNGQREKARELIAGVRAFEKRSNPEEPAYSANRLAAESAYAARDWNELLKLSPQIRGDKKLVQKIKFWLAVENNEIEPADKLAQELQKNSGYSEPALIMVLLGQKNRAPEVVAKWKPRALQALIRADPDLKRFADLLDGKAQLTPKNLDLLITFPEGKRTLLTILALHFPDRARMLLAQADRMNFSPEFPYHFLKSFQPSQEKR